jgi:hypothetical protein
MPRKEFEGFTRLDASDVNIYLMDQAVQSFAGTAARGSAIPSPVEGMVSFLEDSNIMSIYDGSAWATSVNTTGGILQVVSTAKTDTFTLSSSTFTGITGLTATITPKSSTSKILVMFDIKGQADAGLVTNVQLRMVRDSTAIYVGDAAGSRTSATFGGLTSGANQFQDQASGIFLDSPATTSSITYTVQARTDTAAALFINRSYGDGNDPGRTRSASSITLMEVSA